MCVCLDSQKKPPILVVDDDDVFRERLSSALEERGFEVRQSGSAEEALFVVKSFIPRFALLDLSMPGVSGMDLLKELKCLLPDIRVVLLTGYGSITTAVNAMKLGAHSYLTKPADTDEILEAFGLEGTRSEETSFHSSPPTLASVEWEHIQRVLNKHDGNITRAAKALKMHRRSLQRKIAKGVPSSG